MVRSQAPSALTIAAFARSAGVGVETVRFYQRRGLLPTPPRFGGVRRYGAADLRRLRFIRQAKDAGFTLDEIRELLDLDSGEDRARARKIATARLTALDGRIADLMRARDGLARLAAACAEGGTGPCPILASFEL